MTYQVLAVCISSWMLVVLGVLDMLSPNVLLESMMKSGIILILDGLCSTNSK
jgi:hypothetical protein